MSKKEGELKGKDDMIASLNKNIDKLQSQLDALAHRGDFHNQVNPLQAKVDNLTSNFINAKMPLNHIINQNI